MEWGEEVHWSNFGVKTTVDTSDKTELRHRHATPFRCKVIEKLSVGREGGEFLNPPGKIAESWLMQTPKNDRTGQNVKQKRM